MAAMPKSHPNLRPATPEQIVRMQAAGRAKREARKNVDLLKPINFDRASQWDVAARVCGIERLPDWGEPMSVSRIDLWIKRLGLTRHDVAGPLANGKGDKPIFHPARFMTDNPRWGLRAFVGTVIENCLGEWASSRVFRPYGAALLAGIDGSLGSERGCTGDERNYSAPDLGRVARAPDRRRGRTEAPRQPDAARRDAFS